jgi:DNA-binding response OmpR family regulator
VTSIAGKGSIFYATLPLLKQVDSQLVTQSAQKYKRSPIKATTIQTILVIEDDKSDLEWVTNILIANGYVVETAQSGAVALQQTDDRIFDLITLDLILPDTNGYEILRKIRLGINVDTPVIIITAASERNQSMGFLVSDYLVKPIDKEKLLAALNDIGVTANDHRKILVIDDDKKILKLVNYLLRDEGFDLHCVSSPEEGLDLAQEIEPDVIVLDLLMPEMNGFDFIRHLRERQLPKDIPIIVWTVKDLTGEERTFLENSVQGVVLKTLSDSTDQLLKEIKKLTKK